MINCECCSNALRDYEEYYNSIKRQYFVVGCKYGREEYYNDILDECAEFKDNCDTDL